MKPGRVAEALLLAQRFAEQVALMDDDERAALSYHLRSDHPVQTRLDLYLALAKYVEKP